MIEVNITDDMLIKARKLAAELGVLNNSIMSGESNVYGFLGELITLKHFPNSVHKNTYNSDIILSGLDGNEYTVDVKSKKCSSKPLPHYECSVAEYNTRQDCDIYLFTRVMNNCSRGWILGWMPKDEFYLHASHLIKGDYDPSNNFRVRANCFNIPISSLYKL